MGLTTATPAAIALATSLLTPRASLCHVTTPPQHRHSPPHAQIRCTSRRCHSTARVGPLECGLYCPNPPPRPSVRQSRRQKTQYLALAALLQRNGPSKSDLRPNGSRSHAVRRVPSSSRRNLRSSLRTDRVWQSQFSTADRLKEPNGTAEVHKQGAEAPDRHSSA